MRVAPGLRVQLPIHAECGPWNVQPLFFPTALCQLYCLNKHQASANRGAVQEVGVSLLLKMSANRPAGQVRAGVAPVTGT